MIRRAIFISILFSSIAALTACGEATQVEAAVPAPISDCDSGYACGLRKTLAPTPPESVKGIDNFFRLSEEIACGAEPQGTEALEALAAKGIRTILSVDGKTPDAATARRLGMRYVHVPIQYTGVTPNEMMRIAKTFREMPGPFFVHCFHGRHRGPAAAAIGRILRDGSSREQALAEMRQWLGTSGKYEGLYAAVATGDIPTASATKAFPWGFDEAKPVTGVRAGMVRMTRSFDQLKVLHKRGFQPDPDHPDIDAGNEVAKVLELFERMHEIDEPRTRREDYAKWMNESIVKLRELKTSIAALASDTSALDGANGQFVAARNLCGSCHYVYRNHVYRNHLPKPQATDK